MSARRTIAVLAVLLTFAVPDLLACGDKFLLSGWLTRFQQPKNARSASVLIYADSASVMVEALKKDKIESVLKFVGRHQTAKVQTIPALSMTVSNGRFDVILTTNANSDKVRALVQVVPNPPSVLAIDDLVKNRSLLDAIYKEVQERDQSQRDQTQKKTPKR